MTGSQRRVKKNPKIYVSKSIGEKRSMTIGCSDFLMAPQEETGNFSINALFFRWLQMMLHSSDPWVFTGICNTLYHPNTLSTGM